MALAVEQDELAYPAGVGLLGAQAVMLEADAVDDLIEQLGGSHDVFACMFTSTLLS